MGITGCSAPNCSNNSKWNKDQSFLRFPKNPERLKMWLQACRLQDIMKVTADYAYKNLRLCTNHFSDSSFMNITQKNSLVWNAVPSLFGVPNPPPARSPKRKAPTPRALPPLPKNKRRIYNNQDNSEVSGRLPVGSPW
ncbi:52 kDa repressor of the inhibitor of the protein kinase-like [Macrobrachium rosenbergii]|uniref:52 kDa repressor of the inhibitor of the protein kinase-like n=1 Tax=Macrobrachium rosenbergii TaxID=79674 RepID=UPI0034D4B78B